MSFALRATMSRYGVTVQPIPLQFGSVSSFSGPSVTGGGGGGGGGGGAVVLLPLIAALFAPLLASGPSSAPTASPPPPPALTAGAAPSGPAAPEGGGGPAAGSVVALAPSGAPTLPAPVVLTQGPTRTGTTARRAAVVRTPVRSSHPPLPFTGEDLWVPMAAGLQLIGIGAVLRYSLRRLGRGRRRC